MNELKLTVGDKFNHLVVLEKLNRVGSRHRLLWKFRCDCGNEVECSASDVKLGRKTSCGCKTVEYRKNWGNRLKNILTKPDKMGPINKLYGLYHRAAKRRGYDWELSVDEFKLLISKKCYYCNSSPETKLCIAKEATNENTLIYNGIDRSDNRLGYSSSNCRPCCFRCNRMKMDLTPEDFLCTIKKIYENRIGSGG